MIRHELAPTIGWIKSAIREEIPGYEASRTMASVLRLQARLDGLVALIKLDEELQLQPINLGQLIVELWPGASDELRLSEPQIPVIIRADRDLLVTIVANGFQNALEAQSGRIPEVQVSIGAEGGRFWLRMANAFDGLSFDFRSETGHDVSTKAVQRGRGSRFMQLSARRMGFDLRLRGDSGIAILALTGDM